MFYLPNMHTCMYVVCMHAFVYEQCKEFCKSILSKHHFFSYPNLEPNSRGRLVTLDITT